MQTVTILIPDQDFYFEPVSKYLTAGLPLPVRKTEMSAGYDMVVAEDIIIPPYEQLMSRLINDYDISTPRTLNELAKMTKATGAKPTLVSTGMKCHMPKGYYLELSVRSSTPLKNWIILANGVGIIDADYYNNPDNEGEIFFQLINLSPFPISLCKGDIIGQGIIMPYITTVNDEANGNRTGGFGSTSALDTMIECLGLKEQYMQCPEGINVTTPGPDRVKEYLNG